MAILTGDGATIDRAGRIEIATDAEALSGADVDRAITPDQLMAVVSQGVSAVTGGLVYKGVFDATAQLPDLSNAEQGHFYKVEVAGTAFNKTFAVGDMLLINSDMNGVIDPAKVDKIDNGESLAQLDDLTDVTLVNSTTGEVLRYDGNGWVNDKAGTDDVESNHAGVNYTGALNGSLTSHLAGIDSELNNRADTVNSVAVINGAVTIGSDNITGNHTAVNYTGLNTDSITTHLDGIDEAIGNLDGTVASLELDNLTDVTLGTLTAGEVLRYDGVNWVDATLSYNDLSNTPALADSTDDLTSDHTGVNYTGALNGSLTSHLSGIDSELNNRADTVNSVAVINGTVTIGSDDITGNHTAVNYTGLNTDSITTHLAGIDNVIGGLDGTVASLELDNLNDVTLSGTLTAGEVLRYDGANWVDATLSYNDLSNTPALADSTDDLTSDHTGVNYTGALNGSLTSHLSGIDTALGSLTTDLGGLTDVTLGTLTAGEVLRYDGANWVDATLSYNDLSNTPALAESTDDLTSDHTGVNYTGALNGSLTSHLSGIDNALAGVSSLELDDLTDVSLTGTLTNGEVLRYDGANWVDATLSYNDLSNTPALAESTDDLTSDHTGVNYTGALNGSLTSHLSGIDNALAGISGGSDYTALTADVAKADFSVTNYYTTLEENTVRSVYLPNFFEGDSATDFMNKRITVENLGLANVRVLLRTGGTSANRLYGSYDDLGTTNFNNDLIVVGGNYHAYIDIPPKTNYKLSLKEHTTVSYWFVEPFTLPFDNFTPQNNDILAYNSTTGKWENSSDRAELVYSFKNGDFTAEVGNFYYVDSSAGDITISLSTANTVVGQRFKIFKASSANSVTIYEQTAVNNIDPDDGALPATSKRIEARSMIEFIAYSVSADFTYTITPQIELNDSDLNASGEFLIYDATDGAKHLTTAPYTLPTSDGTPNQMLVTNGSGVLSFTDQPTASASAPTVTSITPSSDYTITTYTGVEEIYIVNNSADISINLPSASTCGNGYKYNIKNNSVGGFTLTLDPNGAELIDNQSTVSIPHRYESLTIVSNGTNWFII